MIKVNFAFVFYYLVLSFFGGWGLLFCADRIRARFWRGGAFVLCVLFMSSGYALMFLWGFLCDRCNGHNQNCHDKSLLPHVHNVMD